MCVCVEHAPRPHLLYCWLRQPGHFWQADHIVPVAEGGGMCELSNFRTLCTKCHAQETKRQQHRARLGTTSGVGDIRDMLSP